MGVSVRVRMRVSVFNLDTSLRGVYVFSLYISRSCRPFQCPRIKPF